MVQAVIAQAKQIEQKYKVPVSVIAEVKTSPMPWTTTGFGATIFIIVPMGDNHTLLQKIRKDPDFVYSPVSEMWSAEELVKLTRANPRVIRNNIGGMGFIPPFFFHREVYGGFAKKFRQQYSTAFGAELETEVRARFERSGIKSRKELGRLVAWAKGAEQSEKKLFGKEEQRQTFKWLKSTAEQVVKEEINTIVVLDRSARYLALPLKKVIQRGYKKPVQVFFIDPGMYRDVLNSTETNMIKLRQQLQKEHPRLVKAIRGGRLLIVDDLIYSGKTLEMTQELLKGFGPKRILQTALFPRYEWKDVSWREQKKYSTQTNFKRLIAERAQLTPEKRKEIHNMRKGIGILADNVVTKIRNKQSRR